MTAPKTNVDRTAPSTGHLILSTSRPEDCGLVLINRICTSEPAIPALNHFLDPSLIVPQSTRANEDFRSSGPEFCSNAWMACAIRKALEQLPMPGRLVELKGTRSLHGVDDGHLRN